MRSIKSIGVPFILIGGVNGDGDRGLLRRLAGELLLNYDAAEGTGAVIHCRLCTSSRQVVKQMASLAVVLIGGAAHNDRKMGVTMVAQPATLVDGLLLLDYDAVEGI